MSEQEHPMLTLPIRFELNWFCHQCRLEASH